MCMTDAGTTQDNFILPAPPVGGRKEMFYLPTHSTHFIYGYMEGRKEMFYLTTHSTHYFTVIWRQKWLRTILIVRKETRCHHIGYSFRLTARVLLYAPSHQQDSTYHSLCYTSREALAGTRNSSMGSPQRRIDPTTHHNRSERSYHGATSRFPCRTTAPISQDWLDRMKLVCDRTFPIILPSGEWRMQCGSVLLWTHNRTFVFWSSNKWPRTRICEPCVWNSISSYWSQTKGDYCISPTSKRSRRTSKSVNKGKNL